MDDLIVTQKTEDDRIILECFFNDILQGNAIIDNDNLSIGLRQYIENGSGAYTLRSAVPESELSEYNIAVKLLNYIKSNVLIPLEQHYQLTPGNFGFKSHTALIIEENYKHMNRDELLNVVADMHLQLEAYAQAGF